MQENWLTNVISLCDLKKNFKKLDIKQMSLDITKPGYDMVTAKYTEWWKAERFSPKIRNKTSILILVLKVLARLISRKKGKKTWNLEKKQLTCLSTDVMKWIYPTKK